MYFPIIFCSGAQQSVRIIDEQRRAEGLWEVPCKCGNTLDEMANMIQKSFMEGNQPKQIGKAN